MNDQRRGGNGHTTTADLDLRTSELRSRVAGIGLAINELRHETERLRAAAASRQGAVALLDHLGRSARSDDEPAIEETPAFEQIVAHLDDAEPEYRPLSWPQGVDAAAVPHYAESEPATVHWFDAEDSSPSVDPSLAAERIEEATTPVPPVETSSSRAVVEWIDDDADSAGDAGFVDSATEADAIEPAVDLTFVTHADPFEEVLAWVAPTAPGLPPHPEAHQPPAPPWKDTLPATAFVAPAAPDVVRAVVWEVPVEPAPANDVACTVPSVVEPPTGVDREAPATVERAVAVDWALAVSADTTVLDHVEPSVAAASSAAPVELAPAETPWEPLDDEAEAAFDRFFSAEVETEPARRWLLSD